MSDQYIVPCEQPENDADDWFIEKDGKQYPDDELLTQDQRDAIADEIMAKAATDGELTIEQARDAADEAIEAAEEEAVKDALTRRRHARDKCHVDCYFRLQCLGLALADNAPTHGTWGGYYQEELRRIRSLRDQRTRRASQQTDVATAG